MAIKFEVIILAGEPNENGCAQMEVSTQIFTLKEGFTKHEKALAELLKGTVDDFFKTKFQAVKHSVNTDEEHNNVNRKHH